ncbi:MAG: hypothetical protein C0407_16890 [Desulfobacca sp.]|nr:hypothetical protein [Desulfobacca sp.]
MYGDVLILGQWRQEENGLLIGEFLEKIKKLSAWDKTPYYCFASELLDINTGRRLTEDFLKRMSPQVDANQTGPNSVMGLVPGQFRLGRYRIIVNDDKEVSWQTFGGMDKVIGGKGLVESNLLFLAPEDSHQTEEGKREFLNHLHQLPQWGGSMAWCPHLILKLCQQKQHAKSPQKVRQ